MTNENKTSPFYPALTGLRAIAAYMVFFHHFNPFLSLGKGSMLYGVFSEMHIGVTLFFVLSGFLITHNYYTIEINFKKYIINRFARIYPMYFGLTALTFLVFILQGKGFDSPTFLLNITFLRGFSDTYKFTGVAQGWSLTVEEVFYFSAIFIFIWIKKNKLFLIIMPILLLLLGIIMYPDNINFMLDFTFFGRCFEFFLGMTLSIYFDKIKSIINCNATLLGIIMLLLILMVLTLLKPSNEAYGTDVILGKIINTLILPLFAFLPLFLGLMSENTIISRILASNFFQILGKSSYVFYLVHLGIFSSFLMGKVPYIVMFIILNGIAILLYYFVEKPMNDVLRRISKKV